MESRVLEKSTNVRSVIPAWLRAGMHGLEAVLPPLATQLAERLMLTPLRHRTPRRERPLLDAAQVLTMPWWPRGNTLYGYAWGSGPPILLVHGWAGRATQLGAFVAPLVAAGHSVIGYDLPAHGRSDGDRTNLIEMREALAEIGRRHGPFAGVIAHSMGGAAATMAIAGGLEVHKLVLISTPASLREQTHRFGATLGVSRDTIDRLTARLEDRFRAPIDSFDVEVIGPAISAEALVIQDDDDDEVTPETALRVARNLPRARHLPTRGLGHRRILRDPAIIRTVSEFLTGRALEGSLPGLDDLVERELFNRDAR
jgi:pimeloyl-ACP methyl ester carboxylesterase